MRDLVWKRADRREVVFFRTLENGDTDGILNVVPFAVMVALAAGGALFAEAKARSAGQPLRLLLDLVALGLGLLVVAGVMMAVGALITLLFLKSIVTRRHGPNDDEGGPEDGDEKEDLR